MMQIKCMLFGSLMAILASEAFAMDCNIAGGVKYSCPITADDPRAFCCVGPLGVEYCCKLSDYLNENPGMIAGIVIGVLIIIVLPVCCCICCFCACCPIAQRRVQRGAVLYRY